MTVHLYPAEFVFPGHPDKLSDAIADALVAEASRREARALVGVEVAVHRNNVFVTGRIACTDAASIDVDALVRDVYRSAGYGDGWYPGPEDLNINNALCLGALEDGEAEFRELSDDQTICIGYAVDIPQTNYQPVEQWLVRRLARQLYDLRLTQPELQLGPDGKVIVVVAEEGATYRLDAFSCSLQQMNEGDSVALHRAVRILVAEELALLSSELPGLSAQVPAELTVNGAGAFEAGGPEGDNGLTGKKLVMDAYGPRVPIGGGAWSGKDFFKADRAGGLHGRRLAKLLVGLGLAREATVTLAWFPGQREGQVLSVVAPGLEADQCRKVARLVDLSLACSGQRFGNAVDCVALARWGHFERGNSGWEQLPLT